MTEYPPLLPPGMHYMTLAELRLLCVEGFVDNAVRAKLFSRFEELLALLARARVNGEIWVDGSLLTEKPEPNDIDFVVRVGRQYDALPEIREAIDWVTADEREFTHSCDGYMWVEYYLGHPRFDETLMAREYWQQTYGRSLAGTEKGIAVLDLPLRQ